MDELLKRLDRADRVIKKIAQIVAEPQYCLDKNCEYAPAIMQLETLLRRYESDDPRRPEPSRANHAQRR